MKKYLAITMALVLVLGARGLRRFVLDGSRSRFFRCPCFFRSSRFLCCPRPETEGYSGDRAAPPVPIMRSAAPCSLCSTAS